jgi:hypothetical protein
MFKVFVVGSGVAAAVLLTGCSMGEGGKDAGIQHRSYGDRPVYNMPDQYANLSAICIKSHLVIEPTEHTTPLIIQDRTDPSCVGLDGVPPRATTG